MCCFISFFFSLCRCRMKNTERSALQTHSNTSHILPILKDFLTVSKKCWDSSEELEMFVFVPSALGTILTHLDTSVPVWLRLPKHPCRCIISELVYIDPCHTVGTMGSLNHSLPKHGTFDSSCQRSCESQFYCICIQHMFCYTSFCRLRNILLWFTLAPVKPQQAELFQAVCILMNSSFLNLLTWSNNSHWKKFSNCSADKIAVIL